MLDGVGERIRQLRSNRNLSKAQFGKLVGLSGQYVGKLERDSRNISGAVIVKICYATGVSSDYILFGIVNIVDVNTALTGLSKEQIAIALDLLKRLAALINTDNGNNALIQEVLFQQQAKPFN